MAEVFWGIVVTVGSAAVLGAVAAVHKFYKLLISMDFSLKSLTGQNEIIVRNLEGHEKEIGVLKVDVAEIRGTLHGIQKREPAQ